MPRLIFGHPEFAGQIEAAFPKLFEVLPRATESLNDLTSRACPDPEPYQRMIVNLGLLTGLSVKELFTLAGHGFGMGAMKLARTVMETAINAEYLRQCPSEFESYLNWNWVEQHKLLAYVRNEMPSLLPSISSESVRNIEESFAEFRHLYLNKNGDLRQSWCALNLAERAAKTGFADTYKLINPLSSAFIHGTFGGLSRHFDFEKDEDRISIEPSLKYCREALGGGHWCLCAMVATIGQTFNWEPVHSVDRLKEDFHYAWPEPLRS